MSSCRMGPRRLGTQMPGRFLLQQQFRGLHAGMTVEPALHHVLVQEVCNRQQAYTLVVSHPTVDDFEAAKARAYPGRVEVDGFVKSIRSDRLFVLQLTQVLERRDGIDGQCKES